MIQSSLISNQIKKMDRNTTLPSLSVFFPCYNEEKNIQPLVKKFLHTLPECADKYEVIIVNDGSTDQTRIVAQSLASTHPEVRLVNHTKNLGYGAAIQSGIQASNHQWLFYTDGDGQFNPTQLKEFIPFASKYQAIIGYRQNRADGQLRAINARIFKFFIDIIFRLHVKDVDCAFKLLNSKRVKKFNYISSGAMISTEILYRLKKQGIKYKQLPVTHLPRKFGTPTGNHPRVILKAFTETIKLYYYLKIIAPTK